MTNVKNAALAEAEMRLQAMILAARNAMAQVQKER